MKANHHLVSDHELLSLTLHAAKTEQAATLVLLEYLLEIDTRRLYAVKAYHSLFEYCTKELGYSEPAAAERVNAVRLMRKVPDVKLHLEDGRLNLTTAAQIQRFIKTEEKVSAAKVSPEVQVEIITACLGQSKREVERTLLEMQSEPASLLTRERVRTVSATHSEIKFAVGDETLRKITALKELMGDISLESIFDQGLELLILKGQKKQGRTESATTTQPAESQEKAAYNAALPLVAAEMNHSSFSRFIPVGFKRFIFQRSKGQCEFVDTKTNRRCESRYRLQIDHIQPLALGGKTESANLRHLCQSHNLRAAFEKGLGYTKSMGIKNDNPLIAKRSGDLIFK